MGIPLEMINKYHRHASRLSSFEFIGRAFWLAASSAASTATPSQVGITCPNWHLIP